MMNLSTICCVHRQLDSEAFTSHHHILKVSSICFDQTISKNQQWNYIYTFFKKQDNETFNEIICLGSPPVITSRHTSIFLLLWVIMMAVTILCNLLLIASILQSTILKKNTANFLILSLAISDLCVGCFVLPFKVKSAVDKMAFTLPIHWCHVYITVDTTFFIISITNLFVIALDRYIALNHPYKYPNLMTRKRCRIFIASIWFYGAFWGSFVNLNWVDSLKAAVKIEEESTCMVNENHYYVIFVFVVIFLLPVVAMGFIYVQVLRIAKKHAVTIKSLTKGLKDLPSLTIVIPALPLRYNASNAMNTPTQSIALSNAHLKNVRNNFSSRSSLNASKTVSTLSTPGNNNNIIMTDANKRNKSPTFYYHKMILKATKTVVLVYGTFVIAWAPCNIISLLLTMDEYVNKLTSTWYFTVCVEVLPFMSSLLNPFIYGVMNKQYRHAFRSLLESYGVLKMKRSQEVTREYCIARSASPSSLYGATHV